jgi:hypothetical protein
MGSQDAVLGFLGRVSPLVPHSLRQSESAKPAEPIATIRDVRRRDSTSDALT